MALYKIKYQLGDDINRIRVHLCEAATSVIALQAFKDLYSEIIVIDIDKIEDVISLEFNVCSPGND